MIRESDLFGPVKELFEGLGYDINAEVKDCDITATKGDELVVIELKKNLSIHLLSQALIRQKTGAIVYVAVPKPKRYNAKNYRDTLYILKKLELGLVFINVHNGLSYAEIVYEPLPFVPVAENKKKRAQILKEIKGRTIDTNVGGVSKKKIATAFREVNIYLACALDIYGEMSPSFAKEIPGIEKAQSILGRNYYNWFKRVKKGVYALTDTGRREILDYPELEQFYTQKLLDKKQEM